MASTTALRSARAASTPAALASLVRSADAFLFDCDGVLYHGAEAEPGAAAALAALRAAGKKVLFVTNSASRHRRVMAAKLEGLGLGAVDGGAPLSAAELQPFCHTAARAAAAHLASAGVARAFVVGSAGLAEELREAGVEPIGGPSFEALAPDGSLLSAHAAHTCELEEGVGAVVVGYDEHATYAKLAKACLFLREREGVRFVATNLDACAKYSNGRMCPGAGMLVAAVAKGSGVEPVVCGKPDQVLMRAVLAEHGLDASRTVMVGDRLDTDMAFGNAGGLRTLLVLSGVTAEATPDADVPEGCAPAYVADSVAALEGAARVAGGN